MHTHYIYNTFCILCSCDSTHLYLFLITVYNTEETAHEVLLNYLSQLMQCA